MRLLAIIFLVNAISVQAQLFKDIKDLDSIKSNYGLGKDSTWLIRYDEAEQSESALIITFKDSSVCVNIIPISRNEVKFDEISSSCLTRNAHKAIELLVNYGNNFNANMTFTNSRQGIGLMKEGKKMAFIAKEVSDIVFIHKLMRLILSDNFSNDEIYNQYVKKEYKNLSKKRSKAKRRYNKFKLPHVKQDSL